MNISLTTEAEETPRFEEDTFVARDGAKLPYSVWGPRTSPDKIVIAAHSFGEFRDAFALIGQHLAQRNIALWTYDQRGFGSAPKRGIWAGKDVMVKDFQDFVLAAHSVAGPEAPIILLGESMGAAVVISALADTNTLQANALILSGPGVREDRPFRYGYNAALWLADKIWPSYTVDVPRIYDDRLAEHHARRWAEDEKIIDKVRIDTYYGLIRLSDAASNTASAALPPTLVLFGTEDSQIHPKSVCALMSRLKDKGTLRIFEDKPHLMFQIKQQEDVLSLIDQWIDKPGAGIASDSATFCASSTSS
ncbi:MAG: alpha/beta fold hydrolase [Rhodospirillaceae bacterium]